jgi:hypothetical protein
METANLGGVYLKLDRAEQHLNEILRMLSLVKVGECHISSEHNKNLDSLVQRISITPKPDPTLAVLVGDFLFNVRSALDHLVWQLVILNNGVPDGDNMFPITTEPDLFTAAITPRGRRKGRLHGVDQSHVALIEGLQPYHRGNKSLKRLDALHNTDKHRTLNLITVVADNATLVCKRKGVPVLDMFIGDEELCDGAIFGEIGIPLNDPEFTAEFPTAAANLLESEMYGKATLFVAFDQRSADSLAEEFRVDITLRDILGFVRERVVPTFEPLFV